MSSEITVPAVPIATTYCRNDLRRWSTVPIKHDTVPGIKTMTTDPFESLYQNSNITQIYISGRLTLLRVPEWLNPGEWIRFSEHPTHSAWHRRLTSQAFLWLRSAVNRAMESGNVAQGFEDAPQALDRIAEIGIETGAFTADKIAPGLSAPEWFRFNSGLPAWADEIGPYFLASY